jgi:hypothetical protein
VAARSPRVELFWWDGCPSWPQTLEDLRAALADAGLDPDAIEVREITSEDEAERERFTGSPTIRVEGADLFPLGDEPVGLTCRVYRLRDGRYSPTPDVEDLRDALARVLRS